MGPLAIRRSYLPRITPWLQRFIAASKATRVEEISIALRSLMLQALDAHKTLLEQAQALDIILETGCLAIFETDKAFQSFQWDLDLQRRRGVNFEIVPSKGIRSFEPSLNPVIQHAVYYPDTAQAANGYRLAKTLADEFVQRGGTILKDKVTGFIIGPDGPTCVTTPTRQYPSDNIVAAAGAWSKPLTRQLGHDVPLETERGYHVTLPHAERMPRMPLYSIDHSFVITPLDVGLRLAGTVELGGLEAAPDYRRADILMRHGHRLFGDSSERQHRKWMGHRPSMPNSVPVISRGGRWHNTYFAYGHGHVGLTLGPLTGRLIAGRDPGLDMRPFRVDRF